MFEEPTRYYSDYSDILTDYRQTKFMISLYGEIKSYISRIKTHLNKELDLLAQPSKEAAKTEEQVSAEAKMIVKYLLVFQDDRAHLKLQFLKIKAKQVSDKLKSPAVDQTDELSKMKTLESRLSIDYLKTAVNDYKELFLSPLKSTGSGSDKRPSALAQAQGSVVHYSRYSNLKTKEVIALKSENEEKGEVRDLAKFATQLTQGFFSEAERILLELEGNEELKEALFMLDQMACSLQALCSFEYRIERQGEHQGRLML